MTNDPVGAAAISSTFYTSEGLLVGCYIISGAVEKGSAVKVLRYTTNHLLTEVLTEVLTDKLIRVKDIRHFKCSLEEASGGMICGLIIEEGTYTIKTGDILQIFASNRHPDKHKSTKINWKICRNFRNKWSILIEIGADSYYCPQGTSAFEEGRQKAWAELPKPPEDFNFLEEGMNWIKSVDPNVTDKDVDWIVRP